MVSKDDLDKEIKSLEDKLGNGAVVTVVQVSGLHLGGKIPAGVHDLTYTSMIAGLSSFGESISEELRLGRETNDTTVNLKDTSKLYVCRAGPQALLGIYFPNKSTDPSRYEADIKQTAKNLAMLI